MFSAMVRVVGIDRHSAHGVSGRALGVRRWRAVAMTGLVVWLAGFRGLHQQHLSERYGSMGEPLQSVICSAEPNIAHGTPIAESGWTHFKRENLQSIIIIALFENYIKSKCAEQSK